MDPGAAGHLFDDGRPPRRVPAAARLTPQENGLLDEIEHGLAVEAPALFARMSGLADPPPVRAWARLTGAAAFGAMLAIFVIASPVPLAGALVALLAVAFAVPRLVPIRRTRRDPPHP